jgi:hypothetical protein
MKMKRSHLALTLGLALPSNVWARDVEENEDPFSEDRAKEGENAPKDDASGEERKDDSDSDEHGGYIDDDARMFGREGDVAISAERLLGLARTTTQTEVVGAPDLETDTVRRQGLLNAGGRDFLGYSAARIGFDWFAWEGVSLGVALGGSADTGPYDYRQYTVSPRFGYAHSFSKNVGAWARASITYQDNKADEVTAALLAVGGTLDLVFVPVKNVVLLAGPRLDASLLGKLDRPREDKVDIAATELGFSAGFGIFF